MAPLRRAALAAFLGAVGAASAEELDADVIVVGLGPVGAFLAQLLAAQGVPRVLAFEKDTEPYSAPRAVAWDDYTVRAHLNIDKELDSWARWHSKILHDNYNVHCGGLKSGNASDRWRVSCDSQDQNDKWRQMVGASVHQPGVIFHQPQWERRLRRHIEDLEGVTAYYGMEVLETSAAEDGSCKVTVRLADEASAATKTYRARYCVAVDGGASRTRRQLGLRYEGSSFPDQPWVVVDTEVRDEAYPREAWFGRDASGFVMNPRCPFVFIVTPAFFEQWWAEAEAEAEQAAGGRGTAEFEALRDEAMGRKAAPYRQAYNATQLAEGGIATNPLGAGYRFEFYVEGGLTEEEATSPERVDRLLRECAEVDPSRLHVKRAVVYTFHARRAEHWRVGPILLAGDAAHCMPPFQGQGMNSGIRDAANLAWKLSFVLRGQAGEEILDSYQKERLSNLEQVQRDSLLLGSFVMMRNPLLAYIRDWYMDIYTRLATTEWFQYFFGMQGIWTEASHISAEGGILARGQAVSGQLFPCPDIPPQNGEERRQRLDEYMAPHSFTLVLCAGADASTATLAASPESLAFLRSLGAWTVAVQAGGGGAQPVASAPILEGLGGGARIRDAGPGWARFTKKYALDGSVVVVRPDRYVFGKFSTVDDAARAIRSGLRSPGSGAGSSSGGEL